jgi:hypothetical protein
MEALSAVAKDLGKNGEAAVWAEKSKAMLELFIEKLWDGSEFLAQNPITGECFKNANIVTFQPGNSRKALPQ